MVSLDMDDILPRDNGPGPEELYVSNVYYDLHGTTGTTRSDYGHN